jgi:hypothetical protein
MGEGVGITPFCGPADLAVFAGIRQPWARLRWIRCGLVIARGFSLSGLLRAAGHVACLWRCTDGLAAVELWMMSQIPPRLTTGR